MRVLGLVTARGGSRGFPGKNVARLAGRPLVAWSHRLLRELRRRRPGLDVFLSTDDPAIADAWPAADRPHRLRPAALATDDADSMSVVRHELAAARAEGRAYDAVLLVQPTSPLLAVDDLDAAWHRLEHGCPSVLGVTPVPHPVQWSLVLDRDAALRPVLDAPATGRRQAQPPAYLPCGFYLCTTTFLDAHDAFLAPGVSCGIVVPPERAVDVDLPTDLDVARCHLRQTRGVGGFDVGTHRIGGGAPVFVIAEAGVNHGGDPAVARALVDAAAEAGATAVKFQTFRAADLATRTAPKAAYQRTGADDHQGQRAMLERLELPVSAFADLKAHAEARGLVFLSSPFDPASARLLLDLGVAAVKLGSGELTNAPLLELLAAAGPPLLVSTGMATLDEVEDAARTLREHGDPPVAWLHCVSSYPAPPEASNLRAMESLRLAVGGPVGMSDHAPGDAVTLAAVALGAEVIEKHLTLSRAMEGPDHAASLEPEAFRALVAGIRTVEGALGDGVKAPVPSEQDARRVARKSLVAARDLGAGTALCEADLVIRRPGTGLPPGLLREITGRVLATDVPADEPLREEHLR